VDDVRNSTLHPGSLKRHIHCTWRVLESTEIYIAKFFWSCAYCAYMGQHIAFGRHKASRICSVKNLVYNRDLFLNWSSEYLLRNLPCVKAAIIGKICFYYFRKINFLVCVAGFVWQVLSFVRVKWWKVSRVWFLYHAWQEGRVSFLVSGTWRVGGLGVGGVFYNPQSGMK